MKLPFLIKKAPLSPGPQNAPPNGGAFWGVASASHRHHRLKFGPQITDHPSIPVQGVR